MKNHHLTILALLLACGTACQQKEILPEEAPVPEPEKKVVITASFAQADTRIAYTEDPETHKLHQDWEVGDVLFGFDDSSNPLTLEVTAVDEETGVATLDVAAGSLPESGAIHMLYTGDREGRNLMRDDLGIPVAVNIANQVAATATTVPAILTADAAVSGTDLHLVFESQTAVLGIKGFHGVPAGSSVVSFYVEGVNNFATVSLENGKLKLSPSGLDLGFFVIDYISVDKAGGWTADDTGAVDDVFYVAVFPNSQASPISLQAYDSQENSYTNPLGAKTIAAGKYYYMNNKELRTRVAQVGNYESGWADAYSIEDAFALASSIAGTSYIYLSADCAASADLSLTASATRSAADPVVQVILDLDGSTLDMNGHSICVEGAGASLSITNSWGTGVLLQEADVPVLKVSDGSLKVLYEEEEDGYNPVIKCTSHTTGYSPIVVTGGNLRLEGGYYFFNTTARLINSASADYAYVAKECRFNKNPGFTASSCTLDRDHMIGKAKPVTVDGITYNYRYVDNHAAYDTNDGKFKHFTINADGEVAYLSKFNLMADGTMMSSAWDYASDASCLMDRTQYDAAAANGYPSLSKEEWTYLLKTRSASTINGVPNARFVKCTFQEKRGLLIFPDEFEWPANAGAAPAESAINNGSANYDAVVYRVYANTLIARGCVFLQADGYVTGGVLKNANVAGNYWTSSTRNASDSYVLDFGSYRSSQATSYDLKTDYIPNDDCVSLRPAFK